MREFHPNEQNNPVPMVGEVDAVIQRRSAIKLSTGPKIMVAIPIGAKHHDFVLECPQCKSDGKEKYRFTVSEGFEPLGMVPVQFMLNHMNWLPPLNVTMGYVFKSGLLSAAARQIMTAEIIATYPSVDYIFYVDDDMIIPPMGLYTLYNFMETHPAVGAVTGVYTTRFDPPEPLIYTGHGEGASWDFEVGPGAAPADIMGCGAGCLLVRVAAIKDWIAQNPGDPVWCDSSEFPASNGGRITWGHDVRLIRNLREAGWRCCVDGRVLCGHYDIASRKIFSMPAHAPGFKKRNVNTEDYWDGVYGMEGFNTWRTYEAMYQYIEEQLREVIPASKVFELGCGPGVLGQRLTARLGLIEWRGMDLSEVAVAQAKARYLNAFQGDVRTLVAGDERFGCADCVIATELLEHLSLEDCLALLSVLDSTDTLRSLLFATPWECMPPNLVPEHRVFVDQAWLDKVCEALPHFVLQSQQKVDEHHTVMVFVRKE